LLSSFLYSSNLFYNYFFCIKKLEVIDSKDEEFDPFGYHFSLPDVSIYCLFIIIFCRMFLNL
jgi:hypothetical protein